MIDNKVKNRIIGIEKIPASVDEDFHDSTILYINYSPGDYYGQADIALKTWSHENDETHDIIVVFHLEDIREYILDRVPKKIKNSKEFIAKYPEFKEEIDKYLAEN